jgi:hypothetical protein
MAQRIAEERLVLAAARLAATLNGALCGTITPGKSDGPESEK